MALDNAQPRAGEHLTADELVREVLQDLFATPRERELALRLEQYIIQHGDKPRL